MSIELFNNQLLIQLTYIGAALIAGIMTMLIHEIPKSIVYLKLNPLQSMQKRKSVFNIKQYIDPIGLLFFVTSSVGFSRPYAYRIKDKKTNLTLGIVGLASSFIAMLLFVGIYWSVIDVLNGWLMAFKYSQQVGLYYFVFFLFFLLRNMVLFNLAILLVNLLFPVPPFDVSQIIASQSPTKYFTLYQYEKIVQLLLIVLIALGVFKNIIVPVEILLLSY